MKTLTTLLLTLLIGGTVVAGQPPTADQVRTTVEFCQEVHQELVLNAEVGLIETNDVERITARCNNIYVKQLKRLSLVMYITMTANILIAMFISLSPTTFDKLDGKVMCDEVEIELIEYTRHSNFRMEDVVKIVNRCRDRYQNTK